MSFLIYYIIIALIPIWAQMKVKRTYSKYENIGTASGLTGAEVARKILDENGLYHVKVLEHEGFLSDHYNPINKTVNLSPSNYHGRSISGASVAAHEVGHAIQDKVNYGPLRFRHRLVPVANFGSNASWIFILIGMFAHASGLFLLGIIFMALAVLFQLITLPVEFDASSRALKQVKHLGIIQYDEEREARKVLSAAALTYVAAAAVAVIELLRLLLMYTNIFGNNRDE
ncbi:zinc metallopeptidase [Heyndrickxia ginsengihumi]|uniref:Zinc metallopeptidase n=1 Tax=Heyndrickxia ginsengihumi TaxID=363870 RepID=A0A0A6VD98_9BACI|nr:zinc metallopeptidase [Heyndrickxia ginsengihumi]KHD84504.1 Zn-dependent protease [Heyndrickxia ginsengihumi]MBE6183494.1 zinc metallopeptidase [Bacillus sp. (in: firmicutes)]MCM3022933.1 zinc metallopeptidase [Heyndrickxia ginsengihumi]NEY20639.1 zinc metallopeptidase [Heyndrickxia ginsengihumi]